MKYLLKIYALVFLLSVCITPASAQDPASDKKSVKEPKHHLLLQRLIDEKKLTSYYLGHSYGMDGWALKSEEAIQYAYTTPEGAFILGFMFGPDGAIETTKQLQSLQGKIHEGQAIVSKPSTDAIGKQTTPASQDVATTFSSSTNSPSVALQKYEERKREVYKKNTEENKNNPLYQKSRPNKPTQNKPSKSEQFYSDAENSYWISVGNKNAPYIYVFMNPACEHCQGYWKDLLPQVENGNIQIRIIPFGRVKINRTAGAALLSIADPATAWKAYMSGNKSALSASLATKEAYTKVDLNSNSWAKWRLPTPPFTVYRSPQNNKIKIVAGRPDNTLLLLSELVQ